APCRIRSRAPAPALRSRELGADRCTCPSRRPRHDEKTPRRCPRRQLRPSRGIPPALVGSFASAHRGALVDAGLDPPIDELPQPLFDGVRVAEAEILLGLLSRADPVLDELTRVVAGIRIVRNLERRFFEPEDEITELTNRRLHLGPYVVEAELDRALR